MSSGGFEQIEGADSVRFEIEHRHPGGQVMRRLGRAVDDQLRPRLVISLSMRSKSRMSSATCV